MKINKTQDGNTLTIAVEGRVDTTTSPDLEQEINQTPNEVTELILDFTNLDYISSAGLRVMLSAHKFMTGKGGDLKITNVNDVVSEVFEITGFSDILNIE